MTVNVAFADETKIGTTEAQVVLTVDNSSTVLSLGDVTQLIKMLAAARASFPQEAAGPTPLNPTEVFTFASDPTTALASAEGGHPPQLFLHHAGYGWIPFRVSEGWVQQLATLHAQASSAQPSTLQ